MTDFEKRELTRTPTVPASQADRKRFIVVQRIPGAPVATCERLE
jgi:hypothetical protein